MKNGTITIKKGVIQAIGQPADKGDPDAWTRTAIAALKTLENQNLDQKEWLSGVDKVAAYLNRAAQELEES